MTIPIQYTTACPHCEKVYPLEAHGPVGTEVRNQFETTGGYVIVHTCGECGIPVWFAVNDSDPDEAPTWHYSPNIDHMHHANVQTAQEKAEAEDDQHVVQCIINELCTAENVNKYADKRVRKAFKNNGLEVGPNLAVYMAHKMGAFEILESGVLAKAHQLDHQTPIARQLIQELTSCCQHGVAYDFLFGPIAKTVCYMAIAP